MPNVEAKLSYLDGMFNSQADLLEDTRSLLINSSILHIHQENQELKQSVRIADNELKIIMLIDQVRTFPMHFILGCDFFKGLYFVRYQHWKANWKEYWVTS